MAHDDRAARDAIVRDPAPADSMRGGQGGSRVPALDDAGSAGVQRVRDYARGGGSSGGALMECGASTTRRTSSFGMGGVKPSIIVLEIRAAGVQGAAPLQSALVHGSSHGARRSAGGRAAAGAAGPDSEAPIDAIDEPPWSCIPGIAAAMAHATPLPSTSS